ncbi:MAG: diguanylate cyclase [Planctomycetes bacterium]|nr:diguanylate cyclase [Planctomycetota bacterium]
MLEQQFEELRLTGRLPSPTGVGLRILQITQSDDASLEDVVQVLLTDPTLTGRLIRFANSGEIGGRGQVTTAQAAAMRLGLQTVRSIALGFSLVAGHRSGRCSTFDHDGFWVHSLAVAAAAQLVAELRGGVPHADAFTCGLLQGVGRLALASIHPVAYEGVLERARGQTSQELAQIEADSFGLNHRELAAAMLADWRLPAHWIEVVGHVGSGASPEELQERRAVALASVLQDARDLARALTADVDATPAECQRMQARLQRVQQGLGLDDSRFADLWGRVAASWSSWGEAMGVRAKPVLGLADVAQRAQAQGVESEPREDQVEPEQAPLVQRPHATGLRLVLVGDLLGRDATLQAALAADGHAVVAARDGREGLRAALETSPQMLLCDWDLPGGTGLQLARTLRQSEAGRQIQVVVVADRRKEPKLIEAFEAGADEYLLRPIDARLVVARARAAFRVVQLNERIQDLVAEREARIGQLAIATRKLQIATVTDALTGLHNRRYAVDRLQKSFEISRNGGGPLSVLCIDLDRFKSVNDEHGHDAGDAVLQACAKALAGALRKGDALCRMGGEEFLAICPGADLAAATEIGERLRGVLHASVIRFESFERVMTASIGVAQLQAAHGTIDELLKCADRRVYLAKEAGRDRVVASDPPTLLRAAG